MLAPFCWYRMEPRLVLGPLADLISPVKHLTQWGHYCALSTWAAGSSSQSENRHGQLFLGGIWEMRTATQSQILAMIFPQSAPGLGGSFDWNVCASGKCCCDSCPWLSQIRIIIKVKMKKDLNVSLTGNGWKGVKRIKDAQLNAVGRGREVSIRTGPDLSSVVPLKVQSKLVKMELPYWVIPFI